MTELKQKSKQKRYEIFTQTVGNLLVESGHRQQDTQFWPNSRTYTYPPSHRGHNDLYIPSRPYSEKTITGIHMLVQKNTFTQI